MTYGYDSIFDGFACVAEVNLYVGGDCGNGRIAHAVAPRTFVAAGKTCEEFNVVACGQLPVERGLVVNRALNLLSLANVQRRQSKRLVVIDGDRNDCAARVTAKTRNAAQSRAVCRA